jgi:ATP-dependent Clp protease ATP-binding subunit ClpC
MNYNFTDRVRKVLAMAREEAIRLQHDYVGTEHILLGLIREGEGVAAAVLSNLNVDLDQIHERVEESVRKGKATIALGELPYTSRAKKVLEFAMAEARDFNHSYVGTEHLLLGLLREEKGIAIGGDPRAEKVIASLSARSKTLREMADQALFYFAEEVLPEPEAARKFLTPEALPLLTAVADALETLEGFSEEALEGVFKGLAAQTGLKLGKIAQPVRVALSGRTASPGIYEIIAIIGKPRVIARLRQAAARIAQAG